MPANNTIRILAMFIAFGALSACGNADGPSLIDPSSLGAAAGPNGVPGARNPSATPPGGSDADRNGTDGSASDRDAAAARYAWVSVQWPGAQGTGAVNLDLHVMDPNGNHYYFLNTGGSNSEARFAPHDECPSFDCVGTESQPMESVYWDVEDLVPGEYEVWVENAGERSQSFDLEIVARDHRVNESGSVSAGTESRRWTFTVGEHDPDSPCLDQLRQLGVDFDETTINDGGGCQVEDAVMVNSPLNGITYRVDWARSTTRFRTSCRVALALHRYGNVMKAQGINEVRHNGSYECRNKRGGSTLSKHATGEAFDFNSFVGGGQTYSVVQHWEHDTDDPQTTQGQVLYSLAHAAVDQGIFNLVLTPNFNADHDDHFHMDLTAGRNSVQLFSEDTTSGLDTDGTCGNH